MMANKRGHGWISTENRIAHHMLSYMPQLWSRQCGKAAGQQHNNIKKHKENKVTKYMHFEHIFYLILTAVT
jgi:hypothetical protein